MPFARITTFRVDVFASGISAGLSRLGQRSTISLHDLKTWSHTVRASIGLTCHERSLSSQHREPSDEYASYLGANARSPGGLNARGAAEMITMFPLPLGV